jgi:hypothetical protein
VTRLRKGMLEELQRLDYSHSTVRIYLHIVSDFARYSPSACSSVLEKRLTPPTLLEIAIYRQPSVPSDCMSQMLCDLLH